MYWEMSEIWTDEELCGLDNAKRKEERLRIVKYLKLRWDGERKVKIVLQLEAKNLLQARAWEKHLNIMEDDKMALQCKLKNILVEGAREKCAEREEERARRTVEMDDSVVDTKTNNDDVFMDTECGGQVSQQHT